MKTSLRWLFFSFNCLLWGLVLLAGHTVYSQVSQIVTVNTAAAEPNLLSGAISWITKNWTIMALVVSEVAALLPTKVNGIVQGVIRGIAAFFKKS